MEKSYLDIPVTDRRLMVTKLPFQKKNGTNVSTAAGMNFWVVMQVRKGQVAFSRGTLFSVHIQTDKSA